jgi:hypothetical protein
MCSLDSVPVRYNKKHLVVSAACGRTIVCFNPIISKMKTHLQVHDLQLHTIAIARFAIAARLSRIGHVPYLQAASFHK